MKLFEKFNQIRYKTLVALKLKNPHPHITNFALTGHEVKERLAGVSEAIRSSFIHSANRPVHKWDHYLNIYEKWFSKYRNKKFLMFEIGVMDGGSLDMWRNYFGPEATLVGIDIDPKCAERVSSPNVVRIGSQDDPQFLRSLVKEFGPPDIVLDDGSHIGRHQSTSFNALFPFLKDGGLYAIEDTHTSYWPDWEGGFQKSGTAIEFTKSLIDQQHAWYHSEPLQGFAKSNIPAIHFYDSIILIEKDLRMKPGLVSGGQPYKA